MEIQQGIGQNEGGVTTVSVSGQALLTGNVTFSAGSNITLTQVGQNIAIASTGSGSGSVTSVASADGSITVTNPTTTPDLAVVKSPKLTTARTIGGVSFDGTANITVASATGGFTISGGDLVLGVNNITMTGSLGATGARLTKGWFTDLQVTNAIAGSITGNATTVTTNANLTGPITSSGNATSIASQTGTGTKFVVDTSPTLVTPVLGVATATSINKVAITAPATSATLTIADGKTLTTSNSITLAGTDGKGINIGAATSLKILTGDGSNMVLSAYTVAAPGTSGNVLTSDGTNWTSAAASGGGMAIGGSITSATQGSILFAGASGVLAQDNANLFWDDTNNRLGLGTSSPGVQFDLRSTATGILQTIGDPSSTLGYGKINYDAANGGIQIYTTQASSSNRGRMTICVGPGINTGIDMYGNDYQGSASDRAGQIFIESANSSRGVQFSQDFSALDMQVTPSGVIIGSGSALANNTPNAQLDLQSRSSSRIVLITKGASSQSANLQEWQNSSATILSSIDSTGKMARYQSVTTAAWGIPAIYGSGRSTAQTAAVTSVATYTVGAADGSFLISSNVLVTTATLHNFTATVTYTDEGNTSRTVTLQFSTLAGAFITAMTNAQGAVPYEGVPLHIRCKAATAITIATTGTFTTVTYNVEGLITQIA